MCVCVYVWVDPRGRGNGLLPSQSDPGSVGQHCVFESMYELFN